MQESSWWWQCSDRYIISLFPHLHKVSRFGLAVRRKAGKQKGLGSIPLRLSLLFKSVVVCGHCLVTLSLTINETLKSPSSLPIVMQEPSWWWQCSDRYIISLFRHLHTPFSPSLISLVVSVDVNHHVYLLWGVSFSAQLQSCVHPIPAWREVRFYKHRSTEKTAHDIHVKITCVRSMRKKV